MTVAAKSTCLAWTVSEPTTVLPRSLFTMSARPLPYSDASSTTKTFGAFKTSLMYLAAAGPWVFVVTEDAVEGLPAVLGERRVGRRRGDGDQAGLVEQRVRRLRLTRERRADDAEHVLVVDRLLGETRRLVRAALGVVVLDRDLAVGVLLVVLVDRELHAVADDLAEVGGVARERAEHADLRLALVNAARAVARTAAAAASSGESQDCRRSRNAGYVPKPHLEPPPEQNGARHATPPAAPACLPMWAAL